MTNASILTFTALSKIKCVLVVGRTRAKLHMSRSLRVQASLEQEKKLPYFDWGQVKFSFSPVWLLTL